MTSSSDTSAFAGLMPGFDFMRQFTANQGAMPALSGWVAPTVSIKEIDKRIADLKAVQFWLEQHGQALRATVQALEVQKMTLTALQGMNVNLADIAKAFAAPVASAEPTAPEAAAATFATDTATTAGPAAPPAQPPAMADPLQWWGALTQQFQGIAANVLREAARNTPPPARARRAGAARKSATQPAAGPAAKSAKRAAPRKPAQPAARRGAADT